MNADKIGKFLTSMPLTIFIPYVFGKICYNKIAGKPQTVLVAVFAATSLLSAVAERQFY